MKKKKPSISSPSSNHSPVRQRTRGTVPAARSLRSQPAASPWRDLAAGCSPLLPLSLAALIGTLAIAGFAARSKARLVPLVRQAQSAAGSLLSRRSPGARSDLLPAVLQPGASAPRLSRAALRSRRAPPVRAPAVPPEQSRVLQRLARLQAQLAASAPLSAGSSALRPVLSLAPRDAIALALAEPAVKAAYLEQLARQGAPPRQPWHLSDRATLLPAVRSPEEFAAPSTAQDQYWERHAELAQAIALALVRYRRLLQAQAVVQARQQSLAEAQRLLARQQALVAAGRETPTALLLLQRTVARSARLLQAAREALASEQWQLLAELDLGDDVSLVASESIAQAIAVPVAASLDPAALWDLAQQHHPIYQRDVLNLQSAEQHSQTAIAKHNAAALLGPRPAIATDDLPHPAASVPEGRAANAVARARQQLQETHRELQAAVSAAIQSVQARVADLEQAQQALAAAEAQFAAQEQLQAAGQSRVSSLQAAQERLDTQRQALIAAQIAYLNALVELDRVVGTLPLRWGVVPRD